MFSKLHTSFVMAVVTGLTPLLLTAAPVLAAEQPVETPSVAASVPAAPASSFEQASGPHSGAIQIPAHGSQWFKFKYAYDNSDADNDPTEALVMLKTENAGALRFEVWTRGRMQNPQYEADDIDHENGKVTPVGHGAPLVIDTTRERQNDGTINKENVVDEQTLVWAGSQTATETFYVLVKNTSDAPVNYTIAISGPDVSY